VSVVENFLRIPIAKQKKIIDVALKAFGANGYKKTSASDIATAAGISKSMIFHYFGAKKALYLYLIDYCSNIVRNGIEREFDHTVTDFFDRLKLSASIEISITKQHPALLSFMKSVYFEDDDEVKADIKAILAKSESLREKIVYEGIDASKFKDGIDLKVFLKIFACFAEGYINQLSGQADFDIEIIRKDLYECLDLLKNNFYKEEYL
jgi:TetR/AcrR family transcriptional regulator